MRKALAAAVLACWGLLAATGCGQLPNPNDESLIAASPEIMMRNLREWRARLDERVKKGQLTTAKRDEIMQAQTKEYLALVSPTMAGGENAWLYGDLYRDAGDWQTAYALYDKARQSAQNEDRRVNDNLRYARAAANLGKVKEAIKAVEQTFSTPPNEKAPILPATLYEVEPAARGKGQDVELAKLLEKAIAQHLETVVDSSTDEGKAFLAAKPVHVNAAWNRIIDLYSRAGRRDLAQAALRRSDGVMRRFQAL